MGTRATGELIDSDESLSTDRVVRLGLIPAKHSVPLQGTGLSFTGRPWYENRSVSSWKTRISSSLRALQIYVVGSLYILRRVAKTTFSSTSKILWTPRDMIPQMKRGDPLTDLK